MKNLIRFNHDFQDDLGHVLGALMGHRPIALSRFADGEIAFCQGHKLHKTADKWKYDGDDTPFALAMREALTDNLDDYYLGLGCPCCDKPTHDWLMDKATTPGDSRTFSNVMVNGNYARFKKFIDQQKMLLKCELVGCFELATIKVPANAINPAFDYSDTVERLLAAKRPILVAAGPLSCVLIWEYWSQVPKDERQPIIDVGSALDPMLKGRTTRRYQKSGTPTSTKECRWFVDP